MVFLFSFSLSCSLWLSELLSLPSYLSAHNQSAHFFYRQTSYARKKNERSQFFYTAKNRSLKKSSEKLKTMD